MTAPTSDVPGPIFMCYRRDDTEFPAARLYDRLTSHFSTSVVFKDSNSIEPGHDFVEAINTVVGACDVLLALIGHRWLSITGPDGRRRLDDPGDFVRLEIEAALERNIRVIPILVAGARMPGANELPPSLAKLAYRQAFKLSAGGFEAETQRLLSVLDQALTEAQRQAAQEPHRVVGDLSLTKDQVLQILENLNRNKAEEENLDRNRAEALARMADSKMAMERSLVASFLRILTPPSSTPSMPSSEPSA